MSPKVKRSFQDLPEKGKPPMSERQKQAVLEQLWLTYYNDTLFALGVITEDEYNKMRVKIKARRALQCNKESAIKNKPYK